MKKIFLCLLAIFPVVLFAQIDDDFETGVFDGWSEGIAGRWEVSATDPVSGLYSLHHSYDNSITSFDMISHPLGSIDVSSGLTTWKFKIRHGYTPSSDNNWGVFLFADQDAASMHSSFNANGYVLGVNYTGSTDVIKFWRVTSGGLYELYNTNYNWQDSVAITDAAAFEITRTTAGSWNIKIHPRGIVDSLYSIGSVTDTVHSAGSYLTLYYEYSSTKDQLLWLDDVVVTSSSLNPNDLTSIGAAPAVQVPAGTISALDNTTANAKNVFSINISDAGTGDGLPTNVTRLFFKNANPVNSAIWQNAIKGIVLKEGVDTLPTSFVYIHQDYVRVDLDEGVLSVPDGQSTEVTLGIYLNETGFSDGETFQFKVDSIGHNWTSELTGSGFYYDFGAGILSNVTTIDVQSTELRITSYPSLVGIGVGFTISAEATNINGIIDKGDNRSVSASLSSGSGTLASVSGLTKNLSSGVVSWSDLTIDVTGYFRVMVSDDLAQLSSDETYYINAIVFPEVIDEQFNDGDFTDDPIWSGSTNDFIVDPLNLELQLYPPIVAADTHYLSVTVHPQPDSLEWRFYCRMEFDPSDNNNARYYLMANTDDLKSPDLIGYFIQIGEGLGTDAIELFRQEGSYIASICRGQNGTIADNPEFRLKVRRSASGVWKIWADYTGHEILLPVAEGTDNYYYWDVFSTGVFCKQNSSSYSKKFFFDDIYVGPYLIDTIPPQLINLKVISPKKLDLYFNEGLDLVTAEQYANYSLNASLQPIDVFRDASNYSIVHLEFADNFPEAQYHTLYVYNVKDLENNAITQESKTFVLYYPQIYDILINEIMTDEDPAPFGLPQADYIELYNKTDFPISIENWTIQPRATAGLITFPYIIIQPDSFLIVCDEDDVELFENYGTTVGLPGLYMSSEGTIALYDEHGNSIHAVSHTTDFYHDTYKDNGGWSMEMIDPGNPCGDNYNWAASNDNSGGTPGRENSVKGTYTDVKIPDLKRVTMVSKDTIRLHFSEWLLPTDLDVPELYTVDYEVGNPIEVIPESPDYQTILLVFQNKFNEDTIYTITVSDTITDCAGNYISNTSARFGIAQPIDSLDFVINEILFNPGTGGKDYVEIYNTSQKVLDLKDLLIANYDVDLVKPDQIEIVYNDGWLVFPEDHIVLTEDPEIIDQLYYAKFPDNLVSVNLPSFADYTGVVAIMDKWEKEIDRFTYSSNMQFRFLNDLNGVSLERVDYYRETNDQTNWNSAAEVVGFGTPTYKNSQYKEGSDYTDEFTLDPESFSPDNDGVEDVLYINYKLDKGGYVGSLYVFDSKGRLINRLAENELLSSQGTFRWDGLDEGDQRCNIGIYVIYFEVFHENGDIKKFKKPCVLMSRF